MTTPLLTFDPGGPNELVLDTLQRMGHAEPRRVGRRRYTLLGRERSTIRAELMVVPLVLSHVDATALASLRTMFADGAQVNVVGPLLNNGSDTIVCSGELTDEMEQGTTEWIPTLTLHEVRNAGTSL